MELNALKPTPGSKRARKRVCRGVGSGTPVVFLHGNVVTAEDFELSGLLDLALHPKFAQNGLVYLAYNTSRPAPATPGAAPAPPAPPGARGGGPASVYSTALARGRFDGKALVDVKEIFVAEPFVALSGGDRANLRFARNTRRRLTRSAWFNRCASKGCG